MSNRDLLCKLFRSKMVGGTLSLHAAGKQMRDENFLEGLSKRRLAENELIFKNFNQAIKKGVARVLEQSKTKDFPIEFYCECSDLNCRQRITLTRSQYEEANQNVKHFVIVCGHENKRIEKEIKNCGDFCIIEKLEKPPSSVQLT